MSALSRAEEAVTAAGENLVTKPHDLPFKAQVLYVLICFLKAIEGEDKGIPISAAVDAMNELAAQGGMNLSGFIIRDGLRFEVALDETGWSFRVVPHEEARA